MRAIDLFAGAGGLSLGLQQAGIEVVAAVEWDADACATYRANVGDHMIERSILDVSPDDLPDCDLMAGGPPCQGFSFAGKRDKDDPRNRLWQEYWRLVKHKQPAFILIENVRGMLAMGEDKPLMLAFAELGYRVTPYLLNAADYGVPQRRFRVFYIGNRLGLPNPCPTPTHAQPPRHVMLGLEPWVTVRQALGIGGQPHLILDAPSSTIRFQNGGHDASPSRMAAQGILRPQGFVPLMMRDKHKDDGTRSVWHDASDTPARTIGTDSRYEIADHWLADAYEYAPTVQADSRLSKPGHDGPDDPRMMLRRLTPRECATLQNFPPDFQFHGTKTSQHRQIGNAVPPGMARAIGEAIRGVIP